MRYRMATISNKFKGFSLVELSVVLAIIALILGSVITLVNRQFDTDKYQQTADTLKIIEEAIQRHVTLSGFLPCPAARDAAQSSATYGIATDCTAVAPSGTTDISTIAGTADDIRIGVVPTRTLNLPDRYMMDAWNMRITYVVLKDLSTNPASFKAYIKPTSGGLVVNDAAGNAMIDASLSASLVSYVAVSHGYDRKGATIASGTTTTTCSTTGLDMENCDVDRIFIDSPIKDENVAENAFYDDLILWKPYHMVDPTPYTNASTSLMDEYISTFNAAGVAVPVKLSAVAAKGTLFAVVSSCIPCKNLTMMGRLPYTNNVIFRVNNGTNTTVSWMLKDPFSSSHNYPVILPPYSAVIINIGNVPNGMTFNVGGVGAPGATAVTNGTVIGTYYLPVSS
jgi:prepilin-type N-terminal cleavage/methylation domain-containing protein